MSFGVERAVQGALDASWLLTGFNAIYLAAQLVVVPGVLVWLYYRGGPQYRALRDTVLLTWMLAIPVYALFPVAPPRLAHLGIIDTMAASGGAAMSGRLSTALYNPLAAVPSLHAGFALAVSVAGARATHGWRRMPIIMWTPLVWLVVVATGNHFVFDVVAGLAMTLMAGGVVRLSAATRRLHDGPEAEAFHIGL